MRSASPASPNARTRERLTQIATAIVSGRTTTGDSSARATGVPSVLATRPRIDAGGPNATTMPMPMTTATTATSARDTTARRAEDSMP